MPYIYIKDVPTLLAFMRATAADQNVPDAVKATETDLLNTIDFDQLNSADPDTATRHARIGKALLVVAPEGDVAGMAIYFMTYVAWLAKSGMCLEDLYVLPEYRRRGYARLLVEAVAKKAEEGGCSRMEWLCYKQNHRALSFYRSIGANEMEAVTILRLDDEAMASLADRIVD